MAQNIEIKARVWEFERVKDKIEKQTGVKPESLHQEDTFFNTPNGRLKLRVQGEDDGQLISYQRADQGGPKLSLYYIYRTSEPESLKHVLSTSLGVRGVVRKVRSVYLVDNLRIHLDQVEDLGNFLELEVVLSDGFNAEIGDQLAQEWMQRLEIKAADLIEGAYLDLLEIG